MRSCVRECHKFARAEERTDIMDLSEIRNYIDSVDRELVRLFEKRMDLCREVAEYKIQNQKQVLDTKREKEKLEKIMENTANSAYRKSSGELFRQIMAMSRKMQYQIMSDYGMMEKVDFRQVDAVEKTGVKIVYQGVEGAYSQQACEKIFKRPQIMYFDSFEGVFSAIDNGLWDGKGTFIFWKSFNTDYAKGKNFNDREWFILSHLAPSLGLTYDMDELPFSVKPDKKVDIREVMALYRETYEGTDFDMTRNVKLARPANKMHPADTVVSPIANPWLTTTMRNTLNTVAPGTVEFRRTVAVAWCAYSHITQLRSWLPDKVGGVCWISVDNPGQSPRIPVFCGTTALPKNFEVCGQKQYVPDSYLWQFRRANRRATLAWQSTKDGFNNEILRLEDMAFQGLPDTVSPLALNAYTAYIYHEGVRAWQTLEEQYWLQFGMGF